jgi:hypothetical protein
MKNLLGDELLGSRYQRVSRVTSFEIQKDRGIKYVIPNMVKSIQIMRNVFRILGEKFCWLRVCIIFVRPFTCRECKDRFLVYTCIEGGYASSKVS